MGSCNTQSPRLERASGIMQLSEPKAGESKWDHLKPQDPGLRDLAWRSQATLPHIQLATQHPLHAAWLAALGSVGVVRVSDLESGRGPLQYRFPGCRTLVIATTGTRCAASRLPLQSTPAEPHDRLVGWMVGWLGWTATTIAMHGATCL